MIVPVLFIKRFIKFGNSDELILHGFKENP